MVLWVCCPACGGRDCKLTIIDRGVLFCPDCAMVCEQDHIPAGVVRYSIELPPVPALVVLSPAACELLCG